MSLLRLNDFQPGTTIVSADVDAEFNQLVNALNGVNSVDILLKASHASNPVLNINQLSTGLIFRGQANGVDRILGKVNGQIAGIPKRILGSSSIVGNITTGLDTLHSLTLPADSLSTNDDFITVDQGGDFAVNDNDKRIQISFGGQVIHDSGLRDIDTGVWRISYDVVRLTSTTVRVSGFMMLGIILAGTNGALDTGNSRYYITALQPADLTVANLNSNGTVILLEAEGTATDDIRQRWTKVMLTQLI